jgi:4'-phosphopantetheinyl transferase
MIQLYLTSNCDLYDKLYDLCSQYVTSSTPILRSENGKPYFEGNPVFFNISHSKFQDNEVAVIAISDLPIGVDVEVFMGNFKDKMPEKVVSLMDMNGAKIGNEKDFLTYWTKIEAFVKKNGWSVFREIKKISFVGDDLYYDNIKQTCNFLKIEKSYGIITVCTDNSINDIIVHENL